MKKLITSLLFSIITCISFAQNESEHLIFKGVPIDGTLRQYVDKMKNESFEFIEEDDNTAILQGDFAGYKDCKITVSTLKSMDLVHQIVVEFPSRNKWKLVKMDYEKLKSMLTEKYGKPSKITEKFLGDIPSSDIEIETKLLSDEYTWFSIFDVPKGQIQLHIKYQLLRGCYIALAYLDEINTKSIRSHAINDL